MMPWLLMAVVERAKRLLLSPESLKLELVTSLFPDVRILLFESRLWAVHMVYRLAHLLKVGLRELMTLYPLIRGQVWPVGRTESLSRQRKSWFPQTSPLPVDVLLIPMAMLPVGPTGPRGPAILPALPWTPPSIRAVPPPMAQLLAIPTMATGTAMAHARLRSARLTVGWASGLRLLDLSQVPRLLGRGLFPMALFAVGTLALISPVQVQSMLLPLRTPNPLAMLPLALLATLMPAVLSPRHLLLQLLATLSS